MTCSACAATRMERSICTPRYLTLFCHYTSCPRSISFDDMVRCWPVKKTAVFVIFMATRYLSSQSGSRSRTLWSLATAKSARRNEHCRLHIMPARCPPPSLSISLREWGCHP
ncbi:hypothetical protein EVAR_24626_1 [Eumeta japonica]|uniref:Uncharacterized protein n=1 Tax=Eumeta variegata TaxID=151549 RepID=A0A4C1V2E2_EUMVA|nr:hypothetical protein EVAR_24626_1 [Eumeta japonica]